MSISAQDALDSLLSQTPRRLDDMPTAIGLYGLGDHLGQIHYIGKTDSLSFRDRIWSRHITGSEDRSHKLACNYSVGRLWHNRKHAGANEKDGAIARRVRQAFIRKHCSFVCLPLNLAKNDLRQMETEVIKLAGPHVTDWNNTRNRVATFEEPREMVDNVIRELGLGAAEIAALERQDALYQSLTKLRIL